MIKIKSIDYVIAQHPILQNINLHLPRGSFTFLTGPSGAGKTTLLRLCALSLRPTQGEIALFDKNVSHLSPEDIALLRRKMGIISQSVQYIDHLTVYENITLPLLISGLDLERERKNVMALCNWVGLVHRIDRYPDELSGGEQQRMALARAVIVSPDIILADEPTGNLDWEMAKRILDLFIQFNSLGKTVLIATHDLNLIRAAKSKINTRLIRLDNGHVEVAGANL